MTTTIFRNSLTLLNKKVNIFFSADYVKHEGFDYLRTNFKTGYDFHESVLNDKIINDIGSDEIEVRGDK